MDKSESEKRLRETIEYANGEIKKSKRKSTGVIIGVILAVLVLVVSVTVYSLVPRSFAAVFGPQMPQNMSVSYQHPGFETVDDQMVPVIRAWLIKSTRQGDAAFDEIMAILQNAGYCPDPANLLPWSSGRYGTVGDGAGVITISFDVGGSMFVYPHMVTFQQDYGRATSWRFVDADTFDALVNCITAYGTEQ